MTDKRAVMLDKKVTYFGEFSYFNGSCIRIKCHCYVFLVLREINSRFCSKTQWQMSLLVSGRHVGALLGGVSIQISINLGKTFLRISPIRKIAVTWILARSLCISTFFLFPDSRPNLVKGFDFLFWSILNGVTLKTSNYYITSAAKLGW